MAEAIQTGSYVNLSDAGFQEGYFATRQELVDLFDRCDIREDRVVSLKGISFGRADAVESIRNQNPELHEVVMSYLRETAGHP